MVKEHFFAQMNYIADVFLDRAIIKILKTSYQHNMSKVLDMLCFFITPVTSKSFVRPLQTVFLRSN